MPDIAFQRTDRHTRTKDFFGGGGFGNVPVICAGSVRVDIIDLVKCYFRIRYGIGHSSGRPGTIFVVLCRPGDRDRVLKAVFGHTTTIGVREQVMKRYVMDRETVREETPLGEFRKKKAEGFGASREKWEFDDLADAAKTALWQRRKSLTMTSTVITL